MDENTQAKFAEKVKELLNMAKKKKNVLEYQEISDFFKDQPLEVEQMEKVKVYHIERREFDHGATRDMGMQRSKAEIVVFMTQDLSLIHI